VHIRVFFRQVFDVVQLSIVSAMQLAERDVSSWWNLSFGQDATRAVVFREVEALEFGLYCAIRRWVDDRCLVVGLTEKRKAEDLRINP